MEFYRTYKLRLYPNRRETERLEANLETCRWLYNSALQERRDAYENWKRHNKGTAISFYDGDPNKVVVLEPEVLGPNAIPKPPQINKYTQSRELTDLKEEIAELQGTYDHVLRDVLARLEKTFAAFYARLKRGESPGYPRFKSKNRFDSFTYPDAQLVEGSGKGPGWSLHNNRLTLSKVGGLEKISLKIKLHRPIIGKVCTLTINREGSTGRWYACFGVKYTREDVPAKPALPLPDSNSVVGIDLGVEKLATLSTGEIIEHPHYFKHAQHKLAKLQQNLGRKKKGSKRYKKAVRQLAKAHRHVANQRRDYLHKESRKLVERFDVVLIEKFSSISQMVRRPRSIIDDTQPGHYQRNGAEIQANFNRATLDAGWGTLLTFISYKAEEAGKWCEPVETSKFKTSQLCSGCGAEGGKSPIHKEFHCPTCGLQLPRALNSAIVIKSLGLKVLKERAKNFVEVQLAVNSALQTREKEKGPERAFRDEVP